MRGGLVLLAHSARRTRTLITVMGYLLAGFQILLTLAAETLAEMNAFGQLSALIPDFLRQMMGPSLISIMSFRGIICIGYFHMAVVGALIGLMVALATEPASEIEIRFVDLLLSHPLGRHWLITRTVLLAIGAIALVLAMMFLGSLLGLYWVAPEEVNKPTLELISSLVFNLAALMFCWGGITIAFASIARRRSVPGATAGVLALTTYLFDYVALVWKPGRSIAWLFPFHYYNAMDLLAGAALPLRNVWILLAIGFCGFVLAYVLYSRRDL